MVFYFSSSEMLLHLLCFSTFPIYSSKLAFPTVLSQIFLPFRYVYSILPYNLFPKYGFKIGCLLRISLLCTIISANGSKMKKSACFPTCIDPLIELIPRISAGLQQCVCTKFLKKTSSDSFFVFDSNAKTCCFFWYIVHIVWRVKPMLEIPLRALKKFLSTSNLYFGNTGKWKEVTQS